MWEKINQQNVKKLFNKMGMSKPKVSKVWQLLLFIEVHALLCFKCHPVEIIRKVEDLFNVIYGR